MAPDNHELGVMLPYTPLHHLLFAAGAPEVLVMTSANRSSEPIAFDDIEALDRLSDIADAFLIGERPIARRVDDSITRAGVFGPTYFAALADMHRARSLSSRPKRPILAVGADLKNTHYVGRGRASFRQSAHRRPGTLPISSSVSAND